MADLSAARGCRIHSDNGVSSARMFRGDDSFEFRSISHDSFEDGEKSKSHDIF